MTDITEQGPRGGVELPEPYATLHHDDGYFTTKQREHDLRYSGPLHTEVVTIEQAIQYGDARALAAREQQWQTIESAPKDGTSVLMFRKGDLWPGVVFYAHGRWSWSTSGQWAGNPTHWAPCLPPPPASPQEQT